MRYIKIIVPFLLLSAVILHPLQIQNNGLLYGWVGNDDFCYIATASAITYGQWPHYNKEQICESEMPMASVGPGIMASPFVFLFSFIDRATGNSVTQIRSADNIVNSATSWGFIFASLFYFGLTLVFLRALLRKMNIDERTADISIILMLFFQGVLLYVVRRPVISHVYELFSLSALLLFLKSLDTTKKATATKNILLGGLLCFLVGTSRYNDLPLAFIWPAIFLAMSSNGKSSVTKEKIFTYAKMMSVFLGLFLIFKVLPTFLSGKEKYAGMAKNLLFGHKDFAFWLFHVKYFFFGMDWGLLYTAPFLLVGLTALFFTEYPEKKRYIFLGLTLGINFYLAIHFGTNGGWYGYRYFIFSAFPVALVPFAFGVKSLRKKDPKFFWIAATVLSIVPVLSMLMFEGNDTLIQRQIDIYGQMDYGNLDYQLKVWRILIHEPMEILRILFKGVPVYVVYCVAKVLGLAKHLPILIQEKFSPTGITLVLRTVMMLIVPIIPLALSERFFKTEP